MDKYDYPKLGETVYKKRLSNGLDVAVIHKPDYYETIGVVAVKFGAINTIFRPKNRKLKRRFPDGIAHFLEHKLFELPGGEDGMLLFSQLGADVNAFTGYQQTVYYFSATDNSLECLNILQAFTSGLHLTEDSLAKEKAIISQEIKMYQDDPDYQLYIGLLSQLYPDTPLASDIAGTVESIEMITIQELKMNFDLFYQPSNMLLLVISPENPEGLIEQIEVFQAKRRQRKVYEIDQSTIALDQVNQLTTIELDVANPKLAVGFRSQLTFTDMSISTYQLALKLFLAMIIGWTSSTYQQWYEKGWIDDSFAMELELTVSYQFLMFTLDTQEPIAMSKRIRRLFHIYEKSPDLTEEHFALVKKEMYADFIKSLNNLEHLAMDYVNAWINGNEFLEISELLNQVTFEDALFAGQDFFRKSETSEFIIFPQ